MGQTVHVLPVNDLIKHIESEDCQCKPVTEPVKNEETGDIGWLISHNAADGRE